MNLQVSNFEADSYQNAILADQILGGSEEYEIVTERFNEAISHSFFPVSSINNVFGSIVSWHVVEDSKTEENSLSMAALADKMFPDYKEFTKEEAKEHNDAFMSFFD